MRRLLICVRLIKRLETYFLLLSHSVKLWAISTGSNARWDHAHQDSLPCSQLTHLGRLEIVQNLVSSGILIPVKERLKVLPSLNVELLWRKEDQNRLTWWKQKRKYSSKRFCLPLTKNYRARSTLERYYQSQMCSTTQKSRRFCCFPVEKFQKATYLPCMYGTIRACVPRTQFWDSWIKCLLILLLKITKLSESSNLHFKI